MTLAGDYTYPVRRMVRTGTKNTNNGDVEESFTAGDLLIGAIELDGASESDSLGGTQAQTTGVIRFRWFPTVTSLDELHDLRYDTRYKITGVRFGVGETICDVVTYDTNLRDV